MNESKVKLLEIIEQLEDGWDGENSQRIASSSIAAARRFVAEIDTQPIIYGGGHGLLSLVYQNREGIPYVEVTILSKDLFFISNRVLNEKETSINDAIFATKVMIELCQCF
jgi:hypothetical protein